LLTSTLERLRAAWRPDGLALISARPADPTGYGRILRGADGGVVQIVEEKDCTPEQKLLPEANAGVYCVDAALLRSSLERVGTKNAQREFYLTDLAEIASAQTRVEAVEADAEEIAGINDRSQLAACEKALLRRTTLAFMKAGVTLRDPARVVIEVGV